MDHVLFAQVLEGLENLNSESSDQTKIDSLEVIVLDELVEVDGKQFE